LGDQQHFQGGRLFSRPLLLFAGVPIVLTMAPAFAFRS
jgi:hypothetical protein